MVGCMPRAEFDPPQRFVAGTVGPPGMRTFFLQARSGNRLYAVSLEKGQVTILADKVLDLLDTVGEGAEPVLPDAGPLEVPIEDEFRVAALTLAWDTANSPRCGWCCPPTSPAGSPAGRRPSWPPGAPHVPSVGSR